MGEDQAVPGHLSMEAKHATAPTKVQGSSGEWKQGAEAALTTSAAPVDSENLAGTQPALPQQPPLPPSGKATAAAFIPVNGHSPAAAGQSAAYQQQPTAADSARLASVLTASLKESGSLAPDTSEPAASTRQRRGGTAATHAKWGSYENLAAAVSAAGQGSNRKGQLTPSGVATPPLAQTLAAAVDRTEVVRLIAAIALALLTASSSLLDGDSQSRIDIGAASPNAGAGALPAWLFLPAATWGRQLERLPALVSVALLDVLLVGAALLVLRAQPALAGKKASNGPPRLLMKLGALVPGLSDTLALLTAWQKAVTGVFNDAAAFVVTLVLWNIAPLAFPSSPGASVPDKL
ncbi:hypothetical protein N2152v2_008527 [Parachlorella kessleri]